MPGSGERTWDLLVYFHSLCCWAKVVPQHCIFWRHDIQHKDTHHKDTHHTDTQHKDTQHKDTQHNGIICDTQHNDTQPNSIKG